MNKQIIIVGGGISGLSALYYLRKKYADRADVAIKLLEKESVAGGTIKTARQNDFQFETGPNGFLDNKPSTLELARELNLSNELIAASPATKIRYICVNNILYSLPSGISSFFDFKPLRLRDKLRVAKEFFIAKGHNSQETVYEFGTRRLGENFAKYFLDPMVSGIFGGNAEDLNLQYAFPRIYQIEQQYGSLFKGMIALSLQKRRLRRKNSLTAGQPTGQLWSFKNGMGQLTDKLIETSQNFIETEVAVEQIFVQKGGFRLQSAQKEYFADELILSVPAFSAAEMLQGVNKNLADELKKIPYASITVVGLVYDKKQFDRLPQGFGYLRPTHEGKEVLGVLFSSNIFPSRCPEGKMLFQIMLGGARNPDSVRKSDCELLTLAKEELTKILGAKAEPNGEFLLRWGKAIPQYDRNYPQTYSAIKKSVEHTPHLHLLANYLGGVSLNDCTLNAKALSENINI